MLLGLVMGLVQVKPMVPSEVLWGFGIVGLFVSILLWRAGAQQAEEADASRRNSEAILANVAGLVTGRQDQDNPIDWSRLSDLSNAQLRAAALSLASQMRVFDAEGREREDLLRAGERARNAQAAFHEQDTLEAQTTPEGHRDAFAALKEQRRANWQAERASDDITRAAHARAFKTQFLSKAIAMRDELMRRQGIPLMGHNVTSPLRAAALDHGILAGVNPIGDAAAVIERLARSLP